MAYHGGKTPRVRKGRPEGRATLLDAVVELAGPPADRPEPRLGVAYYPGCGPTEEAARDDAHAFTLIAS